MELKCSKFFALSGKYPLVFEFNKKKGMLQSLG